MSARWMGIILGQIEHDNILGGTGMYIHMYMKWSAFALAIATYALTFESLIIDKKGMI